ncbi:sensor histidine kinase [Paramagnetospirillum magneticum]|uniref:histidine kinase n=1 Tax=Paramagnetospirillum magneticum (strain ATCC 700264 / AMB-1) TaxID=342108 RepID=Q2VZ71_PARM1|nr:ATP-binding protein [Paramagnetospirillum magneticum]BAE53104.1 Signal transduction histidine kinase regulating C4-dicarboxylate transport system [Paramagnetospirillum magneticum AMB-1]
MPRLGLWRGSFAVKLASIALIFAVVPVLIYLQLETVETQRNALMLRLAQEQGKLAGEALFPLLEQFSPRNADRIDPVVRRLGEGGMSIKVLFRPAQSNGARNFLLVASAPETGPQQARPAMDRLVESGVLAHLAASCEGRAPLALRLAGIQEGGELLTYLAPHATRLGCWVVLTAQPTGTLPEQVIGRPYWQSPDLQVAASIYLLMAVLVLSIFTDAWGNLRRFQGVARSVVRGEAKVSFVEGNRVPELAEVAAELDSMVATLKRSEGLLRQAAEENAHALKAPLAVISQSLEPLGRAVAPDNVRAVRALDLIGQSVERLDGLVSTIRRTDETIAALIDRPRDRVDASALLNRLGRGYIRMAAERSVGLDMGVAAGLWISGSDEMLEVIAENLLDNAIDFSPPGGRISMDLRQENGMALLRVRDNGPGVPEGELERIFERHVSQRGKAEGGQVEHYGLGLWIVRRNAEAMGGKAWAAGAPGGGLEVSVALPLGD